MVVGVGEATHGTHEFFTMKHRIFRFLAEQPPVILDLRHPYPGVAASLAAPRTVWDIGAVFPPGRNQQPFASECDVAIWISQSTPSRLRPF